ncbi:MAG: diphthine--ammonia ligase [Candidatus Lokiarchaeota archaeon]|nr:diphthine--ammonia ligase [Candidatus Lokiarchaeota archaeon]
MKVIMSWSGGKDSALALYNVLKNDELEVCSLLTTITESYERISMHGVRKELLEAQSQVLDLPLELVYIPTDCSNEIYNKIMKKRMMELKTQGIKGVVFGDIFLEDIRNYREENLFQVEMEAIFPLWELSTLNLAHTFINLGFKTVITCIDSEFLDKSFVGRQYDNKFLLDLPESADPCGENGEFHTFVYGGPIFTKEISFKFGKVEFRENRFYYQDLFLKNS